MTKHPQSFVVRYWQPDNLQQRIRIEHIQSGDSELARSIAEAIDWIAKACATARDAAGAASAPVVHSTDRRR